MVAPTKADVSIAEQELRLQRNSRRDPAHNIFTMRNLHNCAIARGTAPTDGCKRRNLPPPSSFVTSIQPSQSIAMHCHASNSPLRCIVTMHSRVPQPEVVVGEPD